MMNGSSNVPAQFYHSPPMFLTSVPPLAVYLPSGSEFGFKYGIVQQTPMGSLFATRLSGSSGGGDNDNDDNEALRRNLQKKKLSSTAVWDQWT
ncbi:hypothetical protein V6N13_082956 [Hibiscus sabdariffa]